MKTIKLSVLVALMLMGMGISTAQEEQKEEKRFQMFSVHEDRVIPSKVMEYEKTAKMLADKFREHNISGGDYLTTSTDNFRYLYVSPIEKMADLDENPGMAQLSEKMGQEAFGEMIQTKLSA